MSFLVRTILKKVVIKLATDQSLRKKVKTVIKNTKNLSDNGELLKTLGKSAGRLRKKIKK